MPASMSVTAMHGKIVSVSNVVGRDADDPAAAVDASPVGLDRRTLVEIRAGQRTRVGRDGPVAASTQVDEVEVAPRDVGGREHELDDVRPGAGASRRAIGAAGIGAEGTDLVAGRVAGRVCPVIAVIGDREHDRLASSGVEAGSAGDRLAGEHGRLVHRRRAESGSRSGRDDQQPGGQGDDERDEDQSPEGEAGVGDGHVIG